MDFVKQFVEEGYALLTTMGISVGSILLFLINWLKTKAQSVNKDSFYKELQAAKDEVEIRLKKEYDAKFDEYQHEIVRVLTSLENKVMGKIDSNEAERKEELAKQTLELEATINAVQKKASIDEILGE